MISGISGTKGIRMSHQGISLLLGGVGGGVGSEGFVGGVDGSDGLDGFVGGVDGSDGLDGVVGGGGG